MKKSKLLIGLGLFILIILAFYFGLQHYKKIQENEKINYYQKIEAEVKQAMNIKNSPYYELVDVEFINDYSTMLVKLGVKTQEIYQGINADQVGFKRQVLSFVCANMDAHFKENINAQFNYYFNEPDTPFFSVRADQVMCTLNQLGM